MNAIFTHPYHLLLTALRSVLTFRSRVLGFVLWLCAALTAASCTDDALTDLSVPKPLQVVEGIEGTLTLTLGAHDFEQRVSALTRADMDAEWSEQHIHSVYLFVVSMESENPAECPIIARKFFPDVTDLVKDITVDGTTLQVVELSLRTVSCQKAEIFAVGNLGFSDLQHIANDDDLLTACDASTTLADLTEHTACLAVSADGDEVRVERTQGHLLMSGFFADCSNDATTHYLSGQNQQLTLKAEEDGTIALYDAADGNRRFSPLSGSAPTTSNPTGAVILQRLDSKITFVVEPAGELADTEGAYFRLTSWQVMNAPVGEPLSWQKEVPVNPVKRSKLFRRDIQQTESDGYTFTFYQFENCNHRAGVAASRTGTPYLTLSAADIVEQYNLQHSGQTNVTEDIIEAAMAVKYPNEYTNFAYSLREQQQKLTTSGPYDPDAFPDPDEEIVVTNGDWQFAPPNATYVLFSGNYYNPSEPVRRRADDERNKQFADKSLTEFPYWSVANLPVKTREEAAKRTRTARVTYVVHLGYVGGGNYLRTSAAVPATINTLEQYLQKVNDYNVLRNHHYTYRIGIAGVNSVKVEATREDAGNVLEQEKQPAAEGIVIESQHLYDLDAHYETRNLTIDFRRMPADFSNYGFRIKTNYEELTAYMKQKDNGTYGIFDDRGQEINGIRGHDLDWIHFAWHGTADNPSFSRIDPLTGNGISYTQTYGGYETQQSYRDPEGKLTQQKDATHTFYLMNSSEFVLHVWNLYQQWLAANRPDDRCTTTYTIFVDEHYYDLNPVTGANVDWMSFTGTESRSVCYFMEKPEISADQNSIYTDAHLVISQHSIQTPYATSTAGGQTIAEVAFGIEHLDEFHSKYRCAENDHLQHYLAGTQMSKSAEQNGLFNTMRWYYKYKNGYQVIKWEDAERYYNDKERARVVRPGEENTNPDGLRNERRFAWTVYARNRDLNRDGSIQPDEIRWFIPTTPQYTLCFLAGRAALEHPLYEREKAHIIAEGYAGYLKEVPFIHYVSNSSHLFWAEEGCSVSKYLDGGVPPVSRCHTIRMGRMLTSHGKVSTGAAIPNDDYTSSAPILLHDPIYIVSESRNGPAIDPNEYSKLQNGKNYYITLHKINTSAFRDYVHSNDLAQHDHEQQNNWLYREFKIARYKIGYTQYNDNYWKDYDRTPKVDGIARTWWQLNGVWSPSTMTNNSFGYNGSTTSIAWHYNEDPAGNDLHRWRVPNQRECAIMSMIFSTQWFGLTKITARTRSANLGPNSTTVPYFSIESGKVVRLESNSIGGLHIRPVHDVQAGD